MWCSEDSNGGSPSRKKEKKKWARRRETRNRIKGRGAIQDERRSYSSRCRTQTSKANDDVCHVLAPPHTDEMSVARVLFQPREWQIRFKRISKYRQRSGAYSFSSSPLSSVPRYDVTCAPTASLQRLIISDENKSSFFFILDRDGKFGSNVAPIHDI